MQPAFSFHSQKSCRDSANFQEQLSSLQRLNDLGHFHPVVLLSLHVVSRQIEVMYFCSLSIGQKESHGFILTAREAGGGR